MNPTASKTRPAALKKLAKPLQSLEVEWPACRILYVDDELPLRILGQRILTRAGYQVQTAVDGAEAWAALHDQDYDLLITDFNMPRLNGLELIRKVRQADMRMEIILASGALGAVPLDELPELKCRAMLAKPFTQGELLTLVGEVLETAADQNASDRPLTLEEFHIPIHLHRHRGINE